MKEFTERFHLTLDNCDNTLQDNKPNEWTDILRHQVPIGTGYLLTKSDTFGLYLVDKKGNEIAPNTMIRLEIKDVTEQEKILIQLPLYYFHLSRTISKLDWIDKEINIKQLWWIVVSVLGTKSIDIRGGRSLVDLHLTRFRDYLGCSSK